MLCNRYKEALVLFDPARVCNSSFVSNSLRKEF